MTLTLEILQDAIREVKRMSPPVPPPELELSGRAIMARMSAVRVIFSPYALKATTERNFPESKNRSKRIHKKLVKRFGSEFRMEPCMWRAGNMLYAHPAYRQELQQIGLL